MTTETKKLTTAEQAAKRFRDDTTEHELKILHDDGLYRHLRFKKPGTMMYHFDLVTWPGYLAITGDVGTSYTFRRTEDMFAFFRGPVGRINAHYWSEKLIAGRETAKEYSEDLYHEAILEHVGQDWTGLSEEKTAALRTRVEEELLDRHAWDYPGGHHETAVAAIRDFEYDGFRFGDSWEWDLTEYGFWFQWACHAIVWGIAQYDAAKPPTCRVCGQPASATYRGVIVHNDCPGGPQ